MKKTKNSIRYLFSRILPITILLPILMIIICSHIFFVHNTIKLTNEKNQFLSNEITSQIDLIFNDMIYELDVISKIPIETLQNIFIDYKKIHPFIKAFFITNTDGIITKSIPEMPEYYGKDLSVYNEFEEVHAIQTGEWVSSLTSLEKEINIAYFYPQKSNTSTTEIIGVSLDYKNLLKNIICEKNEKLQSTIFITTDNNIILYSSDDFNNLHGSKFSFSKSIFKKIISFKDEKYFYYSSTLDKNNLKAYVLFPYKIFTDNISKLLLTSIIGFLIVLIFTILLIHAGKRYISEPIINFANASTQLANGNYVIPQSHTAFHEIKVLSKNFYTMAAQIIDNKKFMRNSEKKFRALVEESVDMIFRINRNFRLTYISPAVGALLGYGEKELMDLLNTPGEKRNDILPNIMQNTLALRLIMNSFENDRFTKPFVLTIRHSDNSLLYFEIYMHRLKDKRNSLELQGSARNITPRYIAEQKVSLLQNYFHDVINSLSMGVLTFNEDFTVEHFNTGFLNIFQLKSKDVLNRNIKDLSPILKDNFDHIERIIQSRNNETFSFEKELNGKNHFFDVTISPMARRKNVYILHVFDTTYLREAQQQLENEKKAQFIGTLASGLAHDLNNISGGLAGILDLIDYKQITKDNADLQEDFINIRKAIIRSQQIISKMVSISQVDKSRFKSCDLHKLAHDVSLTFKNHGLTFIDNINSQAYINGDAEMLGAMFNYIISCSLKMKSTTIINMELSQIKNGDNHYCQIVLHNLQAQIPQEELDKLFDPFFQSQTMGQHFGFDLTFAYTIIHNHGGKVSCISNNGVKITILLPCEKQNNKSEVQLSKVSKNSGIKKKLVHGTGKILLIDDEDIVRYTAIKILQMCGYEVISAATGKEALDLFKENNASISCVIVDFFLPDINGFEVFTELQKINPNTKVILNSAMQNHPKIIEAMKHGFYDFLPKPFTIESLSEIVAKATKEP